MGKRGPNAAGTCTEMVYYRSRNTISNIGMTGRVALYWAFKRSKIIIDLIKFAKSARNKKTQ